MQVIGIHRQGAFTVTQPTVSKHWSKPGRTKK